MRKIIKTLNVSEGELLNEIQAINEVAERSHENLVQIFKHGSLSPFLYFLDMELYDGNLRERVLNTDLPQRYVMNYIYQANFEGIWRHPNLGRLFVTLPGRLNLFILLMMCTEGFLLKTVCFKWWS